MSDRAPSFAEVVTRAIDSRLIDLHTALPAKVTRYDASKQQCDAKPLIKSFYETEEGTWVSSSLPVVTNVPVSFPGGGGFRLVFPLQPGDIVLLVFAEGSLDKWLAQGGEVDPIDPRRHALSDAIAIPGLRSFNEPWSDAEGSFITLGSDSGSADFVALAAKVNARLDAIQTTLAGHQHLSAGSGSPTTPAPPGPTSQDPGGTNAVGSATVKVKG